MIDVNFMMNIWWFKMMKFMIDDNRTRFGGITMVLKIQNLEKNETIIENDIIIINGEHTPGGVLLHSPAASGQVGPS